MDVNKFCFGCMKEKEDPGQRCPYCGFDLNEYMQNCSARALRPGTILNGQYLVGIVLGEGGFGITYLAFDLNLHFPVAIKEYFPAGLAVREMADRRTNRISALSGERIDFYKNGLDSFTEEARSLIRFRHEKGIVQVNTFFYENGTAYMVMEYIHGQSLKLYLQKKEAPFSEAETLAIITPILKALEKIHEAGIIHRDISPDNIMLGTDGKVYLIDFGAARMLTGAETQSLNVVLKRGYTPFEQYYTHGKLGPWTDIYSVCATMYRMLSGKIPQESLSRMEKDEMMTLGELEKRGVTAPLSRNISRVVEKGLALKREERYQSVKELLEALSETAPEKNMELRYYRVKSLKQYLQEKNVPLSEKETLKIMAPVLYELKKMHEEGYIYQEVYPDNIILGEKGKVHLKEYRTSCRIKEDSFERATLTKESSFSSIESYGSGGRVGPWTDIYAVCVTMYMMLSGKSIREVYVSMAQDRLESLYELAKKGQRPPLSWSTSHVVEKGMNLKCEKRYQNIGELLEDLY
ncbi:MAG: protein kinase [Blautia sp.]|nr:protein kinase [Blautia sp.]MDY5030422.1 protein kinase [Blautia sp.]